MRYILRFPDSLSFRSMQSLGLTGAFSFEHSYLLDLTVGSVPVLKWQKLQISTTHPCALLYFLAWITSIWGPCDWILINWVRVRMMSTSGPSPYEWPMLSASSSSVMLTLQTVCSVKLSIQVETAHIPKSWSLLEGEPPGSYCDLWHVGK